MSKKDYIKLAVCIKDNTLPGHGTDLLLRVPTFTRALMSILKEDNSAFDRARFWAACGLPASDL
jgi:hypothetical protein